MINVLKNCLTNGRYFCTFASFKNAHCCFVNGLSNFYPFVSKANFNYNLLIINLKILLSNF